MRKLSFNQWKAAVDQELIGLCGLASDDLPDMNYYMDWEDGTSVEEMVDAVLDYNGYCREDFE